MKITSFKQSNIVIGAGGNPNTGDAVACVALDEMDEGMPSIITRWKLEPQELEKVKETGEIWIKILGTQMNPICPLAFHPFDDYNMKPIDINGFDSQD